MKHVVVPVDGSPNALLAVDFLRLMFGSGHRLKLLLLYILPALPPILADARDLTPDERRRLRAIEEKNRGLAQRYLADARAAALAVGFDERRIKIKFKEKQQSVTQDICHVADGKRTDAVVMARRGRNGVADFILGEVSAKMVEFCRSHPVWIVSGAVRSRKVLVAVDPSENALRAVDHAAFMLSCSDCQVTLFHSTRNLKGFLPQEVIEDDPDLEALWQHREGQEIAPYMVKARQILLEAGLPAAAVRTRVVAGTRSAADDILVEAAEGGYGTILLGRRGISKAKAFFLGSVTNRVLQGASNLTICIVQ
jgi:nucleotide-binding universal stress UspA family protein